MQAQGISAPAEEDDVYEQAVLRHVLIAQPTVLRLCDLTREVRPELGDADPKDAVERAVRELTKVGLLHLQGKCVLPTPAAVYVRGMDLG
jgi:hypothetical protein